MTSSAKLILVGSLQQRILRVGMTASSQQNLSWTRLVLIAAAIIASLSVGKTLFQGRESAPPPVAQSASEVDQMIAALEQRLQQEPSSVEGWRLLGMVNFKAGRYADAVQAYRRAAQLKPDEAGFQSALGEALVMADQGGFPPEADAAFNKAVVLDPKDGRARFFLGAIKATQGNVEGAITDWIALLKDAPADAPWAASVRQKIEEVAKANKIEVTERLAALPAPSTTLPSADLGR
jgi:cytochrome c-type biogenesis protein CcmH